MHACACKPCVVNFTRAIKERKCTEATQWDGRNYFFASCWPSLATISIDIVDFDIEDKVFFREITAGGGGGIYNEYAS